MFKAYAFLWVKCSKAMQNKISGRKDFENKISSNPIKLLQVIKKHSLLPRNTNNSRCNESFP